MNEYEYDADCGIEDAENPVNLRLARLDGEVEFLDLDAGWIVFEA